MAPDHSLSRMLMAHVTGRGMIEVVGNQLDSAKILGGLAKMITDEELDCANPQQLLESALRCIDVVELLVQACCPEPEDMEDFYKSGLNEELTQVTRQLNKLRDNIMEATDADD